MRITIESSALLLRSAGVKSYLWHWLRALRQIKSAHEFRAFPFIDSLAPLRHDSSILPPLETYWRIAALQAAKRIPGVIDILAAQSDIFHASNQVQRKPNNTRLTATIHDLTAWKFASTHTAANRRADAQFADRILKRADGLIAVSENTRNDAIEILGIQPEKITRVYSGVAPEYFDVHPSMIETSAAILGLRKPYVLNVGTIEPRKNMDRLLDAWSTLAPDLHSEYDLIIAGPYGWGAGVTLARLHATPPGVRYLGYVPEQHLPALTAGATLLVYPSLYEGFGFPVVQAMAAGVPVLTSNTSCLPEVAGEGAAYVDPLSVEDLRLALSRLLTSPSERKQLAEAGRTRARRYTWANCANQSIQFFETVSGR